MYKFCEWSHDSIVVDVDGKKQQLWYVVDPHHKTLDETYRVVDPHHKALDETYREIANCIPHEEYIKGLLLGNTCALRIRASGYRTKEIG